MKTAKHWSRARVALDGTEDPRGGVIGLGWSDVSIEDAYRVALERARRAATALRDDLHPAEWAYPYPDRPIREPVIDEIRADGRVIAAITRNTYGALVLNTADVMFIDIDRPWGMGGWLGSLLSGSKAGVALTTKTSDQLHKLASGDRQLGFRMYQTAAGLRVLVTGRTFDPISKEANDLMCQLKADKRYMRLCKIQACFRARLTPKPWRCGMPRSPGMFPYEEDWRREDFADWLRRYEQAAEQFAVCELIGKIGNTEAIDGVRPILTWHDELTCREGLRLA